MLRRFLSRFRRHEGGATAIEYGLIIALIFLAILGAVQAFGATTDGMFQRITEAVRTAIG